MTNEQKETYLDTEKLRQLLTQLHGKKFRLDCGYHAPFDHPLANDITIYNGNKIKVICSQCGH